MTKELKSTMISAVAEKTQCRQLYSVYLAACYRGWAQHCKTALCLFVLSPNPEEYSLDPEMLRLHSVSQSIVCRVKLYSFFKSNQSTTDSQQNIHSFRQTVT